MRAGLMAAGYSDEVCEVRRSSDRGRPWDVFAVMCTCAKVGAAPQLQRFEVLGAFARELGPLQGRPTGER